MTSLWSRTGRQPNARRFGWPSAGGCAVDPDRRGDVRGILHSATAAGLVFSNRAIVGLRADS
jgi:hypothetical protein